MGGKGIMTKAVFVTGAGRGIGASIARRFAAEGWFVGITDVDTANLAKMAGEIGANRVFSAVLDVTDYAAYERVMTDFIAAAGRLDVLVNNAGIAKFGPFTGNSPALHAKIVDVNINGVVNGIHAALPYLKQTPSAHIVSLCSASATYGTPGLAVYSATKFAVRALTEALSQEFEALGIKVSDVLPGFVSTNMVETQGAAAEQAVAKMGGIEHTPDEIAGLVWKAANGDRRHWPGNAQVRWGLRLGGLFPGLMRRMMAPMKGMH
ncbi:SDR family oxidoreductase [Oleomonas cavernae]|uniref:SDR family oxidoreductase n=1 Tax=Oleomonas cavernae TaxID=2320859 RepID=UPI001314FED0|nr:SDR family oxidoreductase [Oleomonas cavernae]